MDPNLRLILHNWTQWTRSFSFPSFLLYRFILSLSKACVNDHLISFGLLLFFPFLFLLLSSLLSTLSSFIQEDNEHTSVDYHIKNTTGFQLSVQKEKNVRHFPIPSVSFLLSLSPSCLLLEPLRFPCLFFLPPFLVSFRSSFFLLFFFFLLVHPFSFLLLSPHNLAVVASHTPSNNNNNHPPPLSPHPTILSRITKRLSDTISEMTATTNPRARNFNVGEQYEILDVVGEGAYGIVW